MAEIRYETVNEVARRYRKHPSSIIRGILDGAKIPGITDRIKIAGAIRTPKSWLIPVGAVEDFYSRITAARLGAAAAPSPLVVAARQRELASVEAELVSRGYAPSKKTNASAAGTA
jgi:hypothetical protein